jgi:hypothetical protein
LFMAAASQLLRRIVPCICFTTPKILKKQDQNEAVPGRNPPRWWF